MRIQQQTRAVFKNCAFIHCRAEYFEINDPSFEIEPPSAPVGGGVVAVVQNSYAEFEDCYFENNGVDDTTTEHNVFLRNFTVPFFLKVSAGRWLLIVTMPAPGALCASDDCPSP